MSDLKAVVFDLDGVISITEQKHSEAKIRVLEEWLGKKVDMGIEEVTKRYAGISSEVFYEEMFSEHNFEYTDEDCVEAAEDKREKVQQLIVQEGIEDVPDALDLIEELDSSDYRLCIASSSPLNHIENVVEALEIEDYFEHFTSAKEAGVGKPDPAVYELAAERLELDPNTCLAIEDSPNGIESCTRAGMFCIGYGDHDKESPAHYVTDSLEEVSVDTIEEVYLQA